MRLRILLTLSLAMLTAYAPRAEAAADSQALVRQFLTTITPPGAKISFGAMDDEGDALSIRDIVAHAESHDGEEVVQRIGVLKLQGLQALANGLFRVDQLHAENIRMDGGADLQSAGSGSLNIAVITASGVEGGRIASLALSGGVMRVQAAGGSYDIHLGKASLRNVEAIPLTRAAVNAHTQGQPVRGENAILNALLNSNLYGALTVSGLRVQKGSMTLLSIAEMGSEPDGKYTPFPASGNLFIRDGQLDLRDSRTAALGQWLGQDVLRFDLQTRHGFSAPARHVWDTSLTLLPDGAIAGNCAADNLQSFSPALLRQTQAASTSSATLRSCNLNFTGTEFVNRWLAQDGAKQGLTADQARAKYLAGSIFVSLDPKTANDPVAVQLSTAMQIFLSQPSRLNIRLDPPGGIKLTDALAAFAILMQGAPEAKSQAMQRLGLNISAEPL